MVSNVRVGRRPGIGGCPRLLARGGPTEDVTLKVGGPRSQAMVLDVSGISEG